ncbi:MAG: hypothetical protein ABGX98_12425 [Pseudomonadota bacterium]
MKAVQNTFFFVRPRHFFYVLVISVFFLASSAAHGQETGKISTTEWLNGKVPRFSIKLKMIEEFGATYEEARNQLLTRNKKGEDLPCSSQILEEISWLMLYTARRNDLSKRFGDLEESLKIADQRFAFKQSEQDGAWGICHEEWFLKLDASVDPLKELAASGKKPKYRLGFLEEVSTPENITKLFEELTISNVARDGWNKRKELNLVVSSLGQLIFLPDLDPILPAWWPREAIAAALIKFMDEKWQNPETAYWGAWYEEDGRIIKTDDLSITFHIASYRDGQVKRWPDIVNNTFRTREIRYPYGWHYQDTQNNHHAYDVARLLRLGWPQMSFIQKARARAELFIMLARAQRLSLNFNGEFDARPYNSVAEAYYFGVSFFDEIGYFRSSKRFWTMVDFDSEPTRQLILTNIRNLDSDDPMLSAALRKLEARD